MRKLLYVFLTVVALCTSMVGLYALSRPLNMMSKAQGATEHVVVQTSWVTISYIDW